MGRAMGWDFGLNTQTACYKRKYRWLMKIDQVSAQGTNCLAPQKSARPSVSFKETEVQHLTETIYYPAKPEWKQITLVLYDLKVQGGKHPVWEWLKLVYDPDKGTFKPCGDSDFKKNVILELYDGCGTVLETWVYENAWPQQIEFGDLDMTSSDIITADITLRYDRAYIQDDS